MKKIYSLMVVALLGTTTIFAQGFGLGLDYMMLSGTMITDADGNSVTYTADGVTENVSSSSAVLNLNYTHPLSEKLDVVGSLGYGMGFGLIPMKASLSYGIASNISANLGMGMYMVTDDSYVPYEGTIGEDEWKGSSNEFGMNFGVAYNMNAIGIGLGYDMIKGDGNNTLNALTISLSYAFGGESKDKTAPKKKKAVAPKKVAAPKKAVAPKKVAAPQKVAAPKKVAAPTKVAAPKKVAVPNSPVNPQ